MITKSFITVRPSEDSDEHVVVRATRMTKLFGFDRQICHMVELPLDKLLCNAKFRVTLRSILHSGLETAQRQIDDLERLDKERQG